MALAFEFGELVAENRQIGFATVGAARGTWRSPQRRQQDGENGNDQQRRDAVTAGVSAAADRRCAVRS